MDWEKLMSFNHFSTIFPVPLTLCNIQLHIFTVNIRIYWMIDRDECS